MDTPIFQLTYVSTGQMPFSPGDLERLLATVRVKNRLNRITGLLLYNGERFLQILEGEEARVIETFERIKGDPRHIGVAKLSARVASERAFGSWDMAFEHVVDGRPAATDQLVEKVAKAVANADEVIRQNFIGYARHSVRRQAAG